MLLTEFRSPEFPNDRRNPLLNRLGLIFVGLLVSSPFHSMIAPLAAQAQTPEVSNFQVQPQTPLPLIVVHSPENAAQWPSLIDRLNRLGQAYRVIEWPSVRQASDLGASGILFLPNVETVSTEQLLALQTWINQGGRVIASGPIGARSSPGVQWALRSLLGAYWAASLTQPATPHTAEASTQPWLQFASPTSTVTGGVIVPTGLSSQSVAVWQSAHPGDGSRVIPQDVVNKIGAAAVVVTNQTIVLGWRWGDNTTPDALDQSWLNAAIQRFQTDRIVRAIPTPPSNGAIAHPASPSPDVAARASTPPPSREPAATASRPISPSPNPPRAARPLPGPVAQPPNRSSAPATPLPSRRPIPPTLTSDPAEQTAPPGLPVEESSLPIGIVEAIAMRQELQNLMGRFESAVLAVHSADGSAQPTANTGQDTTPHSKAARRSSSRHPSSRQPANAPAPSTVSTESQADRVLQQARQNLATFSDLVRRRDYAGARQQWLATRQLLWDNFPTDRSLAQSEIRAMWLDRKTIVEAGSRQGLEQLFNQLAAAGINTVFFETVNAGYPIYPSRVAPQQNPLTRSWDPLAAAVELAHERGMELHAWVWAFAAGNRRHNLILNLPGDYPGPVLAAHPDWANYDDQGHVFPPGQDKPFLDPANPAVRRYLLDLFQEIVTRYDVDGLQLDYIRYPFQNPSGGQTYGYGRAARQQFQQMTGVDPASLSPLVPSQAQLWQQWTDFRLNQINSFVADTASLLRRTRPQVILSTAVFALPEAERLQKIQQNWELWARQGYVDLIVLMSYAKDTNRLQQLAMPWLTGTVDLGSALVLPGIRLLNLSDRAIVDQMQALRDSSAGGYALFAADNFHADLQTLFNQTQGETATQTPIPYRYPFAAAASRYAALQQEWEFLQRRDQLWIRREDLETWNQHMTQLGQMLEELAQEQTPQQLRQTQQALHDFQTQFDTWMYVQALSNSYRVKTWENRLATIDRLLNYGQQVVIDRRSSPRVGLQNQ